ncbi:MAG TPA: hypothetical protein VJP87_00040, partial [Candidatus Acidoferrales bacterium]|nr:hypothetical protein [Candidatus Acidoferrales bacterium]
YFPAVCLMYLCAFWIYRRNRANRPRDIVLKERKNPYPRLRALALSAKRPKIDVTRPCSPTEPWGVIMEWVHPPTVVTLVAFRDGSASAYFSTGGGLIGGQAYEPIRRAAEYAVEVAAEFQPQMQLTAEFPLPQPGIVVFYVLTDSGVFTSSAFEAGLRNNSHALSKLGQAMQAIVTAYRTTPAASVG